jgi:hypothetical protein
MVVIARKVRRQSLNTGGDFQKPIRELVGLPFGNGCTATRAANSPNSAAFVW